MYRQQMLKSRMRFPGITPLHHLRQLRLALLARSHVHHSVLERRIERLGVLERARGHHCESEVTEVVDGHAGADDYDALGAQLGHGFAELVVLVGVFVSEEGDLD